MISYEHPDMKKRPKLDPRYDLKGPARAASEFYKDPNYFDDIPNVNLLNDYEGRIFDHEEGKLLLEYMLEYAISLYNNFSKLRDAEAILTEMLELDKEDRIRARDALLRLFLDSAHGEKVRALLERFPHETSSLFVYSRALIEHISLILGEDGSSEALRNEMLDKAYAVNPFTFWCMYYSEEFNEAIEFAEEIPADVASGSVEEAFLFYTSK